MARFLAFLLVLVAGPPSRSPSVVKTENIRAELVSEVSAVKAGEPFWVGLHLAIRPKWHTYWKNPGDSGLPTEINWKLPAGAKADPIVWPAPTFFDIGGVINYGYHDDVVLLTKITPPADAGGPLVLERRRQLAGVRGRLHPGGRQVRAQPADRAGGHAGRRHQGAVRQGAAHACRPTSPWPARFGLSKAGDPTLVIDAKGLKADTIRDAYFFPAEWGPVANMAKQSVSVTADGIRIPLKKGDAKAAAPQQIAGTLVLTEKTDGGEQRQAFDIVAKHDPAVATSAAPITATGGELITLVQALLFALLGGLILNLMPCVFPVLAMKAAAFARLAGHARSAMRRDGLAYTAGVLVAFGAMAAVVVAIRATSAT